MPKKPFGWTNETGYSSCHYPNGQIVKGPVVTGTPTSVSVPIIPCQPPGYLTITHDHPGGVPLPSQTDLDSGVRVGAKVLCINADGDLRCYERVG